MKYPQVLKAKEDGAVALKNPITIYSILIKLFDAIYNMI